MSQESSFTVALFGLSEIDAQVVGRILAVSKTRQYSYSLASADRTLEPDFALYEMGDERVASQVERLHAASPRTCSIELVAGNDCQPGNPQSISIQRPLTAARLLRTLDRLASEKQQTPEPSGSAESFNPQAQPRTEELCDADATTLAPDSSAPLLSKNKPRALVVDDSLAVRRQVGLALRKAGLDIDFAGNGIAALEMVKQNSYEIIFLDVVMPGMDGYELCKEIKRSRETKHVPVVMLTGKSSPFDKVKGKLSGCNTYLTKPVTLREFSRALDKCLKQPPAFATLANAT